VPCQFQEYVPKRSEFRVTVIGNELFTAEILSQEHPETVVDFRRFDVPVTYRAAKLPDELAERCLRLTHSYGLNFGAIDFVLTPDGRYVFLEINPNGQFLFVQQRVPELRMAEARAACLIRGGNGDAALGS
jgi:glutathione synthase/RimK-type ligase-like ATP-grasp enzyme